MKNCYMKIYPRISKFLVIKTHVKFLFDGLQVLGQVLWPHSSVVLWGPGPESLSSLCLSTCTVLSEKPLVLTDFSLKGIEHRPRLPNCPVSSVDEGEC